MPCDGAHIDSNIIYGHFGRVLQDDCAAQPLANVDSAKGGAENEVSRHPSLVGRSASIHPVSKWERCWIVVLGVLA